MMKTPSLADSLTSYKEEVINDVVLRKDREEREAILSGQAAKKSIIMTLHSGAIGRGCRCHKSDYHSSILRTQLKKRFKLLPDFAYRLPWVYAPC
jgi:hypothetical protein